MDFTAILNEMTALEIFAAILGAISVWFVVKRNILAFPIGIVMVIIYAWIFYQAKLYSDMWLQFFYVVMQALGWYIWSKSDKDEDEKIIVLRKKAWHWLATLGFIAVSTYGLGYYMANNTDASLPYLDAFTTMTSVTAQFWMTFKFLENWMLWIFVDIVYLYQYSRKQLFATVILYAIFTIMAAVGLKEWWKKWKDQKNKDDVTSEDHHPLDYVKSPQN